MNTFTIKDLENLSGIKAHTIRVWEQRYSFLKPERTGTNIRFYSNNELKTVLNIALLNKFGYKISHIDKMTVDEIKDRLLSLNQVQAQQERIVNELVESMVDVDIEKFEFVLDNYIIARGIERSISQIIFPFLEKIGILWLTSHINPAQEHLVTNIIRQKLIVGIESVASAVDLKKTILLFLPEGEYHELGLLFLYYILKSRGAKVLYLGANVPLNDVAYVAKFKRPDFLFSHLTTIGHNFSFDRFIADITKKISGTPIIISGQLTHTYEKKIPDAINFKKSFKEVMEFVSSL
jgi:MerR family transcriptional regulator, light-induced transcriptional regulator